MGQGGYASLSVAYKQFVMGATADGRKELVGLLDGEREISWKDLLLDLKQRGLREGPELAVGDGALGFWVQSRNWQWSRRVMAASS